MKTKKPRYAAKILALVLSMLMLLGAMPVAFAAEPAPVTEWPTFEKAELMYQEPYSNLILVGGKAEIPGTFTFAYPTKFPNRLGDGLKVPLSFIPEDTTNYTKKNGAAGATITVVQSTAARIEGTLSATMQKDQKLSEAEFVKSADFAMMNFNTQHSYTINWENPDKAMDKAGSFEEKVVIASSDKGEEFVKPIEMTITVNVIGEEEVVELKEAPSASEIKLGQTLADSELSGGLVTKGGNPVAGKFVWKDSSIAPKVGTAKYTAVFTPDDPTACAPIETQVAVTTGKGVVEVTEWPTITAEFRGGCSVHDIVTLEGGSANVPGKFQVSPDNKNPGKMGPADVVILFVPDDRTNYDIVEKTFTVNFEAATPEPGVGVRFGANFDSIRRKEVYISGSLGEGYNTAKDQATGTLYMVLDGEKIAQTGRLSYSHTYVSEDTIVPGEHTVYTEYVAGENDVFKSAVSHVETFVVEAFPDVTINDSTGTVVNEYKAGTTIKVTAAEHEKPYYDFSGWTAEGVELTEEELAQQTISFTMPEGDVNLTANYKLNFKNFVKFAFEQIGVKLMALIQQGIEWIKGLLP